jgi:hypothetical protein
MCPLDGPWISTHHALHAEYFEQRNRRNGFRVPELFEGGFSLALAERYRTAGQFEDAQILVTFAADNLPALISLQTLEKEFDPSQAIDWAKVLSPSR